METKPNEQVLLDADPAPAHPIAKAPRRAPAASKQPPLAPVQRTPMDLIAQAVEAGRGVDEIDKLMQLAERMEKRQAEQAFRTARAAFDAENVTIIKDLKNAQYDSMYSSIGNLVNTAKPFLSKHGLSTAWSFDQATGLEVTCTLSHVLGHSESVTLKVPPDTSGAKNTLQQIRSAVTYARSTTFEAVCGLALSDANQDDDGNGSGINRNAVQEAVRDSRSRTQHKPADVAAGNGKQKQACASLLSQARMEADKGMKNFGPYWRGLDQKDRDALAGDLSDLNARAAASRSDPGK